MREEKRSYRKQRRGRWTFLSALLLALAAALIGCSGSGDASENQTQEEAQETEDGVQRIAGAEAEKTTDAADMDYYQKGLTFQPSADGEITEGAPEIALDFSNTDQGYFMAAYTGENEQILMQLTGPDAITYQYYLTEKGVSEAFPLTAGEGDYKIAAYESVGGGQYVLVWDGLLSVTLENELLPFLYSSQYVNYNKDMNAMALADELTAGQDELGAVQAVYAYVTENISYDHEKAATVESGYLPDVDATLASGTGICFDYSALMTGMLRYEGIPTRLDIGYATNVYHAWISVYLTEQGWVDNLIEFDGENWTMMDPTFASEGADGIEDYITDGSNYNLEYIH